MVLNCTLPRNGSVAWFRNGEKIANDKAATEGLLQVEVGEFLSCMLVWKNIAFWTNISAACTCSLYT